MRFLVIGSGGREHALCWSLARSAMVETLYCAPGSDAISRLARCVPVEADDLDRIVSFCRDEAIDLVVPGPEVPLVKGLADRLELEGVPCFGPGALAARLEGSKVFMKDFCRRHNIPTAAYASFAREEEAKARRYLRSRTMPIVIKTDGLAAGKGVVVASDLFEAENALDAAFGGRFGHAGERVVIEDFMDGEEASLFVLVDGQTALALGTAQDHKRIGDGDLGANTGGMGAYAPAVVMTDAVVERALDEIVRPTVAALAAEGTPYRGILYAGLMITADGPRLVEYNVRFGDPECQAILPRLKSDLAALFLAGVEGRLEDMTVEWYPFHAMTVVMASSGYPDAYEKGSEIFGLKAAEAVEGALVFHAGTSMRSGRVIAQGGRVLNVTATGKTLLEARNRVYLALEQIDWPKGFFRKDIGWRALGQARAATP